MIALGSAHEPVVRGEKMDFCRNLTQGSQPTSSLDEGNAGGTKSITYCWQGRYGPRVHADPRSDGRMRNSG